MDITDIGRAEAAVRSRKDWHQRWQALMKMDVISITVEVKGSAGCGNTVGRNGIPSNFYGMGMDEALTQRLTQAMISYCVDRVRDAETELAKLGVEFLSYWPKTSETGDSGGANN